MCVRWRFRDSFALIGRSSFSFFLFSDLGLEHLEIGTQLFLAPPQRSGEGEDSVGHAGVTREGQPMIRHCWNVTAVNSETHRSKTKKLATRARYVKEVLTIAQ